MTKKQVATKQAPGAIGPYSQAISAGNWVYTSGQLGLDPENGTLAEGVQEQARRALQNVQAILEEAGASLDHVVKTTVYLKDMNDFAAVNEIYSSFFTEPYPARSAVEVARLPKDGLVEIEAVARKK
ncbi:RidA family protein [Paenibacillus donghaensis]|uniref:Reactive intermediate/imine deaminase n=1 Tax=Paenibacillus donghaensis TaxID=414771 RepID=A0A2Z2KHT2_9BACL|nr:RidA family protein [Paenibacillus donghaensis]ASA25457.1 reactive intermediate/imine deaminase [Paenibacillus donghaensis]